jgi:hypothetical protein
MYGDAPIVNSATAAAHQTATSEDGLVLPYGGSMLPTMVELLNMLELNTLVKLSLKTTKSKMDFLSTQ